MTEYKFAVASEKREPSGRIDREYTFKNVFGKVPNLERYTKEMFGSVENDLVLQLKIGVSGNAVSSLTLGLKPPEAFNTHYKDMRSYNDILALISSSIFSVLCLIFIVKGLLVSIQRGTITKLHVKKATVVGGSMCLFLNVIPEINQIPSLWLSYDPKNPKIQFLAVEFLSSVLEVAISFVFSTVLVLGTEAMARQTFPKHLQFYRILEDLNTTESIYGILLAYFLTPMFMAYNVAFYLFFRNYVGWWTPTSPKLDPSLSLVTYQPWIACVSLSFSAGFLEEMMFRVLLLSGFYWLANSMMGDKKIFAKYAVRMLGFFIMCFSFSGAHANYPTQPFFGRLVELVFPSIVFGWLFLSYGFLPAFLLHYLYDLIWFSIPVFVSRSPSIWLSRVFVLIFAFLPLLLVGIRIYTSGGVKNRDEGDLNGADCSHGIAKTKKDMIVDEEETSDTMSIDDSKRKSGRIGLSVSWLLIISVALLLTVLYLSSSSNYPNRLGNGTRSVVISESREELKRILQISYNSHNSHNPSNTTLEDLDDFHCFSRVNDLTGGKDHLYAHLTPELALSYHELLEDGYLLDVYFTVTCFRFGIKETYLFRFDGDRIFSSRHLYAEEVSLPSLDDSEVEAFSLETLEHDHGFDVEELTFVKKVPEKRPNERVDWGVVFNVTGNQRQVTLGIQGNQVSEVRKRVFVPETFSLERQRRMLKIAIAGLILAIPFVVLGLVNVVKSFLAFAKGKRDYPAFWKMMCVIAILSTIDAVLGIPQDINEFQPEKPYFIQVISSVLIPQGIGVCISALLSGYLHSLVIYEKKKVQSRRMNRTTKGYVTLICSGLIVCCVSQLLSEVVFRKFLFGIVQWLGVFPDARILDVPSTPGSFYFHALNSYIPSVKMGVGTALSCFQAVGWSLLVVMKGYDNSPIWTSVIVSFVEVFTTALDSEMEPLSLLIITTILFFVIVFVTRLLLYRLFLEKSLEVVKYRVLCQCLITMAISQHSFSLVNYIVASLILVNIAYLYDRWVDCVDNGYVETKKED